MHCTACQYPLWFCRTNRCPECGREFDIFQYHFPHASATFLCPHCDTDHPGCGEHGHPDEGFQFTCRNCHRRFPTKHLIAAPAHSPAGRALPMDVPLLLAGWPRKGMFVIGYAAVWIYLLILFLELVLAGTITLMS